MQRNPDRRWRRAEYGGDLDVAVTLEIAQRDDFRPVRGQGRQRRAQTSPQLLLPGAVFCIIAGTILGRFYRSLGSFPVHIRNRPPTTKNIQGAIDGGASEIPARFLTEQFPHALGRPPQGVQKHRLQHILGVLDVASDPVGSPKYAPPVLLEDRLDRGSAHAVHGRCVGSLHHVPNDPLYGYDGSNQVLLTAAVRWLGQRSGLSPLGCGADLPVPRSTAAPPAWTAFAPERPACLPDAGAHRQW